MGHFVKPVLKPMTFHPKHPGPSSAMAKGTPACPDDVMVKCSPHMVVGGLGPITRSRVPSSAQLWVQLAILVLSL